MKEVPNDDRLELAGRTVAYWFKRYSERARTAMAIANRDAKRKKQTKISPVNVLFGVLAQPESVACHVLTAYGVELEAALTHIGRTSVIPVETDSSRLPADMATHKVVDDSIRICIANRHDGVGTEHLLVAMARSDEIELRAFFEGFDLTDSKLNEKAIELLAGVRDKRDPCWGRIGIATVVSVVTGLLFSLASVTVGYALAYRGLESWKPTLSEMVPEMGVVFCIMLLLSLPCISLIRTRPAQIGACLLIDLGIASIAGFWLFVRTIVGFGAV